jgi:hypothetical protein
VCKNFVGVLVSERETSTLAAIARCKSWYCDECSVINRKRWRAVLYSYVNNHPDFTWCFFTLTAHKKAHNSVDPARYTLLNIQRAWDRLVKRMKRKFGRFEYVRAYEKHESGCYHLHAIATFHFDDITQRNEGTDDEYPDSNWLRENATNLGLGYMTSADNLRVAIASVGYVTKYMVKSLNRDRESWGRVRRIQTSRGIKYNEKNVTPGEAWELRPHLTLSDLDTAIKLCRPIILLSDGGKELSYDNFLLGDTYPHVDSVS